MRVVKSNSSLTRAAALRAKASRSSKTSIKTSKRISGGTSDSVNSSSLKTTKLSKNYLELKNAAAGLQKHAGNLTASGEDSLFGRMTEKGSSNSALSDTGQSDGKNSVSSENQDDLLNEINSFVQDYNTMINRMRTIGGTINNLYLKQMKGDVSKNQSLLKEIGITQKKNGTLFINKKTINSANTEDLQTVFGKKDCFAAKVSEKSEIVESKATSILASLKKSNASIYNRNGYLGSSSISGFLFDSKG